MKTKVIGDGKLTEIELTPETPFERNIIDSIGVWNTRSKIYKRGDASNTELSENLLVIELQD